ncbi:MAG: HDOD domain-containing protein [Steroidobacteraceae bacterium]
MFNPQAPSSENSTRSLLLQQALTAAFKARRQNIPPAPASLPALLDACRDGLSGFRAKAGCRDALGEIRARLFHAPGRDAEAQAWWHESVATAVFAARVAQLKQASVCASFLGGLLHRSGEALALKMLARVELDYRLRLDSASRREWCATHNQELTERLVRTWKLSAEIGSCVLGWARFGEFTEVSRESAAVYFGRLFAIELLQPQFCVPGALEHAAADLGLDADLVAQVRQEDAQSLIRAFD